MTQPPSYALESAKQGILLEVPIQQNKEPPSVVLDTLDEALEDARSMASRGENAATASSDNLTPPKRNRKFSHFNIADMEGNFVARYIVPSLNTLEPMSQ